MSLKVKQLIKTCIYIGILLAITVFLYQLGKEPWLLVLEHLPTLLVIIAATGIGILVQAAAFRKSYPKGIAPISVLEAFKIWAASAVISVITPIFAGMATRTTLLVKAGTPLSVCILATTRQVWMGLEYAALTGGIALGFIDIPLAEKFSLLGFLLWMVMLLFRFLVASKESDSVLKANRYISSLRSTYPVSAHAWFILQLFLMSVVYYAGFNGMGATLNWFEAFALSAVTVFLSLIAFVPNGLGLTDSLWVIVGMQTGLALEASVSLAILIRLGHLLSSVLIYLVLLLFKIESSKSVE